MGKRKYHGLILLLVLVGLLGGCGTPLYELTEDEEDIIVSYAAYAVSKHNIFQKDGYINVSPQEEQTETETAQEQNGSQDSGQSAGAGENAAVAQKDDMEEISLAEAVGHASDLNISYQGFEVSENYNEGNYFSLGADEGKTFLVMKIRMENDGSSKVKVNNVASGPEFKCSYDGENYISAEATFALKVFSSYEGSIKAGEYVDTVLLFQIDKEQAANVNTLLLTVTVDGTTKKVKL